MIVLLQFEKLDREVILPVKNDFKGLVSKFHNA